ncbi:glycosyltransferase family 1 protein [Cohnella pontilimi]|uniref:Glycosyltransferase family 1 protein n=1 Tax=Cohnella pontilimi TaxID=2564100 RepID=A0A4U0FGX4_9BACL|nr:glycosyltransferase [Cohnella pontilimi]TJY44266.1 glycosyltransferase family 1 protein [Cohnella pontilimi]
MKKLKILFMTRDFSRYVERNTYYLSKELEQIVDLMPWHSAGDIHEILKQLPEQPDFILMNEDVYPYMTGLRSLNVPYAIIMYDIHAYQLERKQFILDNGIPHIFSHYRDKFHEWYPELSDRMKWLPIFVNTEIFKDYQLPKEIDWLMMGIIGWGCYPLRNRMYDAMKDKPGFVYHPHPGYRNIEDQEEKQVFVGERYAQEINRAKMFLTCGLSFNYPIIKYYEVLACNTLLLAPSSQELTDLGFVPDENYIAVDENDFMEKTHYYLSEEQLRIEIAERGYRMVHERHSVKKRAGELVYMIEDLLKAGG